MELNSKTVEMKALLVLSEREVEMLVWLASYGGQAISNAIFDGLSKRYTKEEWTKLWSEMRTNLEAMNTHFKDTRAVFLHQKRAASLNE